MGVVGAMAGGGIEASRSLDTRLGDQRVRFEPHDGRSHIALVASAVMCGAMGKNQGGPMGLHVSSVKESSSATGAWSRWPESSAPFSIAMICPQESTFRAPARSRDTCDVRVDGTPANGREPRPLGAEARAPTQWAATVCSLPASPSASFVDSVRWPKFVDGP